MLCRYTSKLAGEMLPGTSKSLPRNVKIGGASRASSVPNVSDILIQEGTVTASMVDKIHVAAEVMIARES